MDPMRDLPMGFGMALVKNQSAMETFSSMTPEQQQAIQDAKFKLEGSAEYAFQLLDNDVQV